ncbi:MAG: aminoacyl-tRNA hydrolase [Ruminococcaceae bacterium]|nr:aminoacyl-tRNA hydrolase [Oscillospiraceae bacterium]
MANIFDLFKKIETEKPAAAGPITHLVVGLGNPGREYAFTRHNAGFLSLDYMAERLGVKVDRLRFKALTAEATVGGVRVLLMKPQTFMNNSGEAVREAAAFYHIPPENVIVICDDINLDVGRLRVRGKGSDGGQKGVRSIIYHLNADTFPRVKVGVGKKPHPEMELADWVLSGFSAEEQKVLFDLFSAVEDGVRLLLQGKLDDAMQRCNGVKSC